MSPSVAPISRPSAQPDGGSDAWSETNADSTQDGDGQSRQASTQPSRAETKAGNPHLPRTPAAHRKAEWKRLARQLHQLGVLTELDRSALAAYCQAYGRWVEAERKLRETPPLLKTPAGYVQPSPWLAISNKSVELMHKFATELGLSPASRSRVTTKPLGPKPWETYSNDDDDEFFR
jgi:P27 family predicted phage terminase small subunit